jgi:hypothetical protein
VSWLVVSLVLSVALTVALNVALRLFPGAGAGMARALDDLATSRDDGNEDQRRIRVIFPWKAMLLGSLLLTIVLNLVLRLR